MEKTVILLCGLPGAGKTSVGSQLMLYTNLNRIRAEYIDQDFSGGDWKKYDKCNHDLINSDCKLIINGKSNINKLMRSSSLKYLSSERLFVIYLESSVKLSHERIILRKYHPNLTKDRSNIEGILTDFYKKLEIPTDEEFKHLPNFMKVIKLDSETSVFDKVKYLMNILQIDKQIPTKEIPFTYCNYIGIFFKTLDLIKLLEKIDNYPHKKKIISQPHITLIYRSDFWRYSSLICELVEKIGTEVKVRVKKLNWDDKISAFNVEMSEIECVSTIPHITFEKENEVPAVYSNEMLQGNHNYLEIEKDIIGQVGYF